MKITRITASAARKVPHPSLEYASISTLVSLEAQMQDGDDPARCLHDLQTRADRFVDAHTQQLVNRQSGAGLHWKSQQATEARSAKLAAKHGGNGEGK